MNLYVISGVTGMTGNELARKLVGSGNKVIGFDNFFASSIKSVEDLMGDSNFCFYEYDLNSKEQMEEIKSGFILPRELRCSELCQLRGGCPHRTFLPYKPYL